eukprot:12929484-Prorocentrum_lima.AAC.1
MEKYWIEAFCGAADPVQPSSTLQWGFPGGVVEGETVASSTPDDALQDESQTLQWGIPSGVEDPPIE